jgi:hypothetical protein
LAELPGDNLGTIGLIDKTGTAKKGTMTLTWNETTVANSAKSATVSSPRAPSRQSPRRASAQAPTLEAPSRTPFSSQTVRPP